MPTEHLEPTFVEFIPVQLSPGQLYVSIEYATTAHLCPCGCGLKVLLPLHPAQWKLCFDGETVTMSPSVGNGQYPCRSHYWIRRNQIHWAEQWTDQHIQRGSQRDRADLERHFTGQSAEHRTAGFLQKVRCLLASLWKR